MFSRFFIDRPIFASVLSIVITLAGGDRAFTLPIAQYPPVTPPTVQVDCNYPGASAQVVAQTVAAPIEQQVNGVEDMLYMSSQSTNDGSYTLTVTFKPGVDLNLAQVLVQNRVSLAMPQLARRGAADRRHDAQALARHSADGQHQFAGIGRYDQLYLSNYALMQLKDETGAAARHQRGAGLRPARLQHADLARSRQAGGSQPGGHGRDRRRCASRTSQVALGQIGQPPAADRASRCRFRWRCAGGLQDRRSSRTSSSSSTADRRKRAHQGRGPRRTWAKNHDVSNRFDGKPTVGLAIFQLPDANALETADRVKAKMEELAARFSRRRGLRDRLRHDSLHSRVDSAKFSRRCATRSFSWRSWCWCSCKAGGRRSFR